MRIPGARFRAIPAGAGNDSVQAYFMLAPVLIGFALFTLYPMYWLVKWAWFDYDGMGRAEFVGMENFVRVFARDPQYWAALANTFYIVAVKLAIEIPLALFLAVALRRAKTINTFFRTVFFVPAIVSSAIVGLVFYLMFEPFRGSVNYLLKLVGLIDKSVNWFGDRWLADWVIIIASIWKGFGLNMVFFIMGLQNIPRELYECADLDGVGPWKRFSGITLPMLAPVFRVVLMLAIVNSMKMSDLVLVLTNGQPGGRTEVVMSYAFKYFFSYGAADNISQYGYSSALAVVTAVILGIITAAYFRMTKRINDIY